MQHVKRILLALVFLFFVGTSAATYIVHKYTKNLPTITKRSLTSDASSNMYASNGKLIWSSAVNKRIYVKYKDIPQDYINLLLSTEDRGFYQDRGISPKGLINAGLSYAKEKAHLGQARGGSSIEQQLIKLSVFSTSVKDRNVKRKIKEMFLAQQLDHNYSKNKILEMYVNKIYLGEGSYGAQTIAKTYYNKTLKQLNLSQLAIIAGLGQAGSYYNLYDNPNAVKIRRNQVLAAGLANHKINHQQYEEALNTPIKYGLQKRYWEGQRLKPIEAANASYINSTLQELQDEGYNLTKTPLQIHTALDLDMNQFVNNVFDKHPEFFQNKRQQAAITITDPRNGTVLAQNGGRFQHNVVGLNRATLANRSTGSSIKPIVDYGPAFEYLGWSTNQPLNSNAYHYAGTNVTATNFGGASYGTVTLRRAVVESMNTPAIRTLDAVGPIKAKTFANKLGIYQRKAFQGSYAIGVNASTAQMASAFGAFSNNGIYRKTEYVKYLIFPDQSRKNVKAPAHRAMSPATAWIMNNILKGVITEHSGTLHAGEVKGIHMAAKTGTVAYPSNAHVPDDSAMDFWTCGYTKSLSIALWEGYDNPMKKNNFLWDMHSIELRGKMWKYMVKHLTKNRDNSDWKRPSGVGGNSGVYYVAHTAKIKTLHNIESSRIPTTTTDLLNIKSLKKNNQTEYDIPKKYKLGSWKKGLDKTIRREIKQDDKKYGGRNTRNYDPDTDEP